MKKNIPIAFVTLILTLCIIAGCSTENSKLRFKAIYLDMDGTTLTSNYEIRPATIAILETFRQCGGKVGIVTGRTLDQVKPYTPMVKPNLPLILYNGGLIVSPSDNKIILKKSLNSETISKIIEKAAAETSVQSILAHFTNKLIVNKLTPKAKKFIEEQSCPEPKVCSNIQTCLDDENKSKNDRPIKIELLVAHESIDKISNKIKTAVKGEANVLISGPESIEIVPKGVDKADALRSILKKIKLRPDEIAIFGDSGNDFRMLGEFPVTMAMGNCRKETCEAALFKIDNNDTDAIADTIRRLVLLPTCRPKEPPQSL